jgi:hypothetical protein
MTKKKENRGMKVTDYLYCEDCREFCDYWQYNHDVSDTSHELHNYRYVTPSELKKCVADCEEDGCFNAQANPIQETKDD